MTHRSLGSLLGLLLLAASASAATVGPLKGRAVQGQPLEVNIPFTVDSPADRACASASVRYGNASVQRVTLDVQGRGVKRNLLVTSRAKVSDPTVAVNVRVGCGAKGVARKFIVPVATPAARTPVPAVWQPPPQATAEDSPAAVPDASTVDDLRKARAEAAAAVAQLEATRRELAAVLDVERRTGQTLINADHQVRDAQSEVGRMRLLLQLVGAGLGLAAAGLAWFEVQRVMLRRRAVPARPAQEPSMVPGAEMPA